MLDTRRLVACAAIVGALIAFGCAKRPNMIGASAPAPSGSAEAQAAPAAPAPPPAAVAPAPVTAAPEPARPAPKEFAAHPELKPIHFDFDRSDIRAGDKRILDANTQWLKQNANQLVLIEGHCDERGTNEYNLGLGDRRAKATMNYLVSQGIQSDRISIVSYGEERPACMEKSESCWAQNRRAAFLVKEK